MKNTICSNPSCDKNVARGPGRTGKFCSKSCAAVVNNKKRKKKRPICPCGKELLRMDGKYCCIKHQHKYLAKQKINDWLGGKWSGTRIDGVVSDYIRNYLLKKAGYKCPECGWAKKNKYIDKVILTIDHIDGNWLNNKPENLRVLCYNCHTLTPTFNSLNRNNPLRKRGRQYNR